MSSSFYRDFEDRHRGTREAIKARLAVYRPFLDPWAGLAGARRALDLGCGRGEWLELLASWGFEAQGIDLDEAMLRACLERGLACARAEALERLRGLPPDSQCVVSAIHVVEHLSFDHVRELVEQAHRVLEPGGLLILETPNPENIVVGTAGFYLDPTHQRPLPPGLLGFVPEHAGFVRAKTLRLQEPDWLPNVAPSVLGVLRDTSPDYAIVAQKGAPPAVLAAFDAAFAHEYGLTLEAFATRYDDYLSHRFSQAHESADRAAAAAEAAMAAVREAREVAARSEERAGAAAEAAAGAEAQAAASRQRIEELLGSVSWRITSPLRALGAALKRMRRR